MADIYYVDVAIPADRKKRKKHKMHAVFDGVRVFRVKLMSYGKIRSDVFEFCRFYARWLGNPLMERLKAEIYELLEQAIAWWGEQDVLDIMGC